MTTTNRVLVYMSKAHVRSDQSQTKAANKTPVRPYTDVAAARSPCTDVAAARLHAGTAPARSLASPHTDTALARTRPRGHKEPKYSVHPSSVKYNISNTHHGREETHVRKVQHHV